MSSIRFQDESNQPTVLAPLADRPGLELRSEPVSLAAINSLLLGLRLRGHLVDSDRLTLDSIAPEGCITFLLRKKRYLHPEGVVLFPWSIIENSTQGSAEAIYSHHWRPRDRSRSGHRIESGLIDPQAVQPLVLGFFGPEPALSSQLTEDSFSSYLNSFRRAARAAEEIIPILKESLDRSEGTVIVNRSSGRILAVNEAAAKHFGKSDHEIAGLEFGSLKKLIGSRLSQFKMEMRNLDRAGIHVAIISFSPVGDAQSEEAGDVVSDLLGQFRAEIGQISAEAGQLKTMLSHSRNSRPAIAVNNIVEQVSSLERAALRMSMVLNFERLALDTADLNEELKLASNRVEALAGHGCFIEIDDRSDRSPVRAPLFAFATLFEALLMVHVEELGSPESSTRITMTNNSDSSKVSIEFLTTSDQSNTRTANKGCWNRYFRRLAKQMGIEVHSVGRKSSMGLKSHMVIDAKDCITTDEHDTN